MYAQPVNCVQLFVTLQTVVPGSSVHGIIHARTLEWVNIFSSRDMDIYIYTYIHQSLISMFMKNYEVLSCMNSGTILLTSEFCQQ